MFEASSGNEGGGVYFIAQINYDKYDPNDRSFDTETGSLKNVNISVAFEWHGYVLLAYGSCDSIAERQEAGTYAEVKRRHCCLL